ncbi:MAG: hypothetical protein HC821_04115, partial [Lewinella sp.]|nr:hypothetical protein [Lewinella sp.]
MGNISDQNSYLTRLDQYRDQAQEAGYRWVEMELTRILSLAHPHDQLRETYSRRAAALAEADKLNSLVGAMPRIESWERALEILGSLGQGSRRKEKKNKKSARLVWFIDFAKQEIEGREQTLNGSGAWSRGRKVAYKRIKDGEVSNMTAQDLAVARTIEEEQSRSYPQGNFQLNYAQALAALVGHPHLYLAENPNVSVELVKRNPQLLVEEGEHRLLLRFAQPINGAGVQVIKETPTRYQIIEVTPEHALIQQQIGEGLELPKRARHRLVEVSRQLGRLVEVQSTLQGMVEEADQIKADSRTFVHLLPIGETFKVEFFVRPIAAEDQYFKPGQGRQKVFTEHQGFRQIADRSLKAEAERAEAVISACPTLQKIVYRDYEWQLEEVEDCLNILLELQPLRAADQIALEHPRGEKIRLVGTADFGDLRIGVKGNGQWFDVEGELQVDDNQVINFRELLERVNETRVLNLFNSAKGNTWRSRSSCGASCAKWKGCWTPARVGCGCILWLAVCLMILQTNLGNFL